VAIATAWWYWPLTIYIICFLVNKCKEEIVRSKPICVLYIYEQDPNRSGEERQIIDPLLRRLRGTNWIDWESFCPLTSVEDTSGWIHECLLSVHFYQVGLIFVPYPGSGEEEQVRFRSLVRAIRKDNPSNKFEVVVHTNRQPLREIFRIIPVGMINYTQDVQPVINYLYRWYV